MEEQEGLKSIEGMYHREDELYPRNEDGSVKQGEGLNFSDLEGNLPKLFIILYYIALLGVGLALLFSSPTI